MTKKALAKTRQKLAKPKKFKPSPKMEKWLKTSLEIGMENISEVARQCGLDRNSWYYWIESPDFVNWFRQEWQRQLGLQVPFLDSIGLRQAKKDYRYYKYWETMLKRAGALSDEGLSPGTTKRKMTLEEWTKDF